MIKQSRIRKSRRLQRQRRHRRIRKRVHGTPARPRLAVNRSLRHIEGQVIDDEGRRTLIGLSTRGPEFRGRASSEGGTKTERARAAGELLGRRAAEHGITTVVFDRGGFRFHGRVKAFADGARAGGLVF